MQQIKKIKNGILIFVIGASGYGLIEIIWRGFTHWSMALTGGFCFSLMYLFNEKCQTIHWYSKCAIGATIITSVEFLVGCIVNLGFHMRVWDYSNLHFNILGQISLIFTGLWFLLSIPVFKLCTWLEKKLGNKLERNPMSPLKALEKLV